MYDIGFVNNSSEELYREFEERYLTLLHLQKKFKDVEKQLSKEFKDRGLEVKEAKHHIKFLYNLTKEGVEEFKENLERANEILQDKELNYKLNKLIKDKDPEHENVGFTEELVNTFVEINLSDIEKAFKTINNVLEKLEDKTIKTAQEIFNLVMNYDEDILYGNKEGINFDFDLNSNLTYQVNEHNKRIEQINKNYEEKQKIKNSQESKNSKNEIIEEFEDIQEIEDNEEFENIEENEIIEESKDIEDIQEIENNEIIEESLNIENQKSNVKDEVDFDDDSSEEEIEDDIELDEDLDLDLDLDDDSSLKKKLVENKEKSKSQELENNIILEENEENEEFEEDKEIGDYMNKKISKLPISNHLKELIIDDYSLGEIPERLKDEFPIGVQTASKFYISSQIESLIDSKTLLDNELDTEELRLEVEHSPEQEEKVDAIKNEVILRDNRRAKGLYPLQEHMRYLDTLQESKAKYYLDNLSKTEKIKLQNNIDVLEKEGKEKGYFIPNNTEEFNKLCANINGIIWYKDLLKAKFLQTRIYEFAYTYDSIMKKIDFYNKTHILEEESEEQTCVDLYIDHNQDLAFEKLGKLSALNKQGFDSKEKAFQYLSRITYNDYFNYGIEEMRKWSERMFKKFNKHFMYANLIPNSKTQEWALVIDGERFTCPDEDIPTGTHYYEKHNSIEDYLVKNFRKEKAEYLEFDIELEKQLFLEGQEMSKKYEYNFKEYIKQIFENIMNSLE